MDAARARGRVDVAKVFAADGVGKKTKWAEAAAKLGIQRVNVPRRAGGGKDPNDMAIAIEATHAAYRSGIGSIMLAVTDADFAYLAERLQDWGRKVFLLIPEGVAASLAKAFKEAGAEVIRYPASVGAPKFCALLHPGGESSVEDHHPFDVGLIDDPALCNALQQMGYMSSQGDPVEPATAKFYHVNAEGPLTIYRTVYARFQAAQLLAQCSTRAWKHYAGDLAFVWPESKDRKSFRTKYGSQKAGQKLHAGGPFITKDSDGMVEHVLSRLGFYDSDVGDSLEEAIDVFCGMGQNRKSLASMGSDVSQEQGLKAKKAMLRKCLLSPKLHGNWLVWGGDRSIRDLLASKKLIQSPDASKEQVFRAMQIYAAGKGLAPRSTYVGLVSAITKDRNRSHPHLRKG